jgi:hypothetical protein
MTDILRLRDLHSQSGDRPDVCVVGASGGPLLGDLARILVQTREIMRSGDARAKTVRSEQSETMRLAARDAQGRDWVFRHEDLTPVSPRLTVVVDGTIIASGRIPAMSDAMASPASYDDGTETMLEILSCVETAALLAADTPACPAEIAEWPLGLAVATGDAADRMAVEMSFPTPWRPACFRKHGKIPAGEEELFATLDAEDRRRIMDDMPVAMAMTARVKADLPDPEEESGPFREKIVFELSALRRKITLQEDPVTTMRAYATMVARCGLRGNSP